MKTLLFVLAVLAATAGFGNRSQAQNYPWCAYYGGTEFGRELRVFDMGSMHGHHQGDGWRLRTQHAICSCPSREGRAANAAARASRRARSANQQ